MNRVYRLVWNPVRRQVQVASELTATPRGNTNDSRPVRGALVHSAAPTLSIIAAAVGLAGFSPTASAVTCSATSTAGCSAVGGAGIPARTGSGGAGNGNGGGASTFNVSTGTTDLIPGFASSTGVGGQGAATQDGSGGPGGVVGASSSGTIGFNGSAIGGAGTAGPLATNFGTGGGGGGAGFVFSGFNLTLDSGATVLGGAGGAGGQGAAPVVSNGGGGGGGGTGLLSTAAGTGITNNATVAGGAGGAGGGGGATGFGGGGGAGGDGMLLLGANTNIVNTGSVTGGAGGAPGNGSSGIPNTTGGGGAGVRLVGAGSSIANVGTISGGNSSAGVAGAGIVTYGNTTITNGGTISGGLSGGANASSIEFGGTGNTLNLLSGSTLNGAVTLDASATATIAAQNPGLSLAPSVVLTDSASTVTFSGMATGLTLSGVVAGAGNTVVTGTGGNITMAAVNTYTGSTTISGGQLALTGSGSIAASSGLLDNGLFDISGTTSGAQVKQLTGTGTVTLGARTLGVTNASGTFAGSINGTGGFLLTSGTQTLTGANSYTGGTMITAGTLALSGGGALSSATPITLASSNATLDLSAASAQQFANLSGASGSRVVLGSNALTVGDATDTTFGGTLSGPGAFVKQGTGTLTLDGVSSAFSGTTTVAAGTLEVGDAANPSALLGGNVQVASNGTLRGHGTVAGSVANAGVVAPGGTIGTLTLGGDYTQASNGTLSIEVSPTAASQLHVGGAAALNGTLHIVYDPGTYSAGRYALLSAGNGVSGRFSSVTNSALAGADLSSLQQSITYGANEVDLALAAASNTTTGGTTPVVIAPQDTTIFATEGTSALNRAQTISSALLARSGRNSAAGGSATSPAGSWISATGSSTKVSGTDGRPGFLAREYGFMAGIDHREGAGTVGIAAGYSHTSIDESLTGDSSAADTLRVALYGARSFGPIDLAATVGYGLDFLSQKRPFGSIGTAEGDHYGNEFSAALQAGMPIAVGSVTMTPRLGLRYAYFRGNGFGESGAQGQNLSVDADNARSLQPFVSLAIDKAFGNTLAPIDVQWRIGYAWEALSHARGLAVTSQDGTTFSAPGTDLPRAYLTTGASVSFHPAKSMSVAVGLDALLNVGHASAQSAYARLDYRF
jgi:autotransporter-associated beta strand protein